MKKTLKMQLNQLIILLSVYHVNNFSKQMNVILKQVQAIKFYKYLINKNSPFQTKSSVTPFNYIDFFLLFSGQMNSDANQQFGKPQKLSQLVFEPIRNISKLSPYHQRVIIEKRYLQKKEKLRSILIMGHLQKMQLNAINNRSIQTMRKTKVAQEMSKKRNQSLDSKEDHETPSQLKIDNRKKRKQKIKTQIAQSIIKHNNQSQKIQQAYEKLIDDYLKQVSQDKLLEKGIDRRQIIEQACQFIKAQMNKQIENISKTIKPMTTQKQQRGTLSQKRTLSTSQQNIQLPSIREFPFFNKNSPQKSDRFLEISSRRNVKSLKSRKQRQTTMMGAKPSPSNKLVIQIEYNENLKKLENEQNFMSKQRMREEKLFLRKMKLIGMKNAATLRSFLKEQ